MPPFGAKPKPADSRWYHRDRISENRQVIDMAASKKGAIAFGLVYIPVELYAATRQEEVRFNQLAKESMSRVRYVKTCAGCKGELKPDDIVKGYQYEKGKYVVVTDDELNSIKTDKDKAIAIDQFVDKDEIPPIYYQKAYQVVAQAGGEKALELLRRAMVSKNKVAIGTTVMGNSEDLFALVPYGKELALITLFYESEIRDIPQSESHPAVSDKELSLAEDLITQLERPFKPSEYKDTYQEKLRTLIEEKVEGKEVVAPKESSGKPSNVIDLMDALSASLKESKPKGKRSGGNKKAAS